MKELYISPELKVLCFAPVERLALDLNDFVDFDNIVENSGADEPIVSDPDLDFGFDFGF